MPIDFDSFFRNRIEALLIRASWVEAFRSKVGLERVSQIWSGNAAWYLWLRRAPGAYALVFSEGDVVTINGQRLFEGRFALKCYPYPESPGYGGFSTEERRWIESDCFDATHTPRFEAETEIPEALFTVGSISLLCDADDPLVLLTYQSLDALRVHQSDAASADSGADHAAEKMRLVRNVAGWSMGYPLFDCLVGLYAHFTGQPPAFMGVTRCRGFEYTVFADGSAVCRPSRRTTQTALSIGFHSSGMNVQRVETFWQERLESGEQIQTARQLPISFDETVGKDLPDNVTLNPLWWDIAALDFKSELTSTCGCDEDHCHHTQKSGWHEH
jgi:hypothetical protein